MTAIDLTLAGLVLAAMAAVGVVDARRMTIEPRLVAVLVGAGLAWRLSGSGGTPAALWTSVAGAALGIVLVVAPILAAHLRGRRWPVFPGDALMLGGFGAVLGPVGLAWSVLLGAGFALAHRVWLQRRRGRPVRKGYCPLGPGMAAGAMAVFLCANAGVALAQEGRAPERGDEAAPVPVHTAAPLAATEIAPPAPALPEALAAREVVVDAAAPIAFPVLARRIAALAGVPVEVEERPGRIAGGAAALPDPPAFATAFRGTLPELLDRTAARGGYDWTWRDGAVVFYRHWDTAQRAPEALPEPAPGGSAPETQVWIVDRARHPLLRDLLESWAARAGWSVVWRSGRHYAVGADAELHGGFLQAVDRLLAAPAVRRALTAVAYRANRHLVIRDAGAVR